MQKLNGKELSQIIKEELKEQVGKLVAKGKRPPHLVAVLVGDDGASQTYVGHKIRSCEYIGYRSTLVHWPADITEEKLLAKVDELNEDPEVDGFIVQLPLPDHVDAEKVLNRIDPKKDVDGFHPENIGRMTLGLPAFLPATPAGIMELLDRYEIKTSGKNCVVIGRSNIVGRPISVLMSRKGYPGNATVTVCHSRTPIEEVKAYCLKADIIIVALGKPGYLTGDMVSAGTVVIDVGTTRVPATDTKSGYRLKGDALFEEVAPKCSYITPVPGGVGPMTVAMLLKNTMLAYGD
ncbi:MAG: tetrahydrofolate dehydrogenase/cyclohydrolase catalytic domain-containing protein [Bacteroidota bacterium]